AERARVRGRWRCRSPARPGRDADRVGLRQAGAHRPSL
ncbi:MAG: hypothetical protein AVDCRST_MAG32-340, partial [uncultured Nocardioides sp.]